MKLNSHSHIHHKDKTILGFQYLFFSLPNPHPLGQLFRTSIGSLSYYQYLHFYLSSSCLSRLVRLKIWIFSIFIFSSLYYPFSPSKREGRRTFLTQQTTLSHSHSHSHGNQANKQQTTTLTHEDTLEGEIITSSYHKRQPKQYTSRRKDNNF